MDPVSFLNWPPAYSIKKYSRSKHVKLKTSIKHGLQLIVPNHFNPKQIPYILEQHRGWIEKQFVKLQLHERSSLVHNLPDQIEFLALNQRWDIKYVESPQKLQLIDRPHHEIALLGKVQNKETCKKILITWIKKQAKNYLESQLKIISHQIALSYSNVTIRDQSTRWGSCSRTKSINLNYKLIFFPEQLVNHILIHELCHTVHLNHSDKFWDLVASFDHNWLEHRREARSGQKYVPAWI